MRDLRFGKDVRPKALMIRRECLGIGQETLWLCSPAIQTEGMHLEHSNAANAGCKMILCSAPGIEGRAVQVWESLVGKHAVQRLESICRRFELPPKSTLHSHVSFKDRSKAG